MKNCTTLGILFRHMNAKTTKRLVKSQRKIRLTSFIGKPELDLIERGKRKKNLGSNLPKVGYIILTWCVDSVSGGRESKTRLLRLPPLGPSLPPPPAPDAASGARSPLLTLLSRLSSCQYSEEAGSLTSSTVSRRPPPPGSSKTNRTQFLNWQKWRRIEKLLETWAKLIFRQTASHVLKLFAIAVTRWLPKTLLFQKQN